MVFGAEKMKAFTAEELGESFRSSGQFAGHGQATSTFRDAEDFDEMADIGPPPPSGPPPSESFNVEGWNNDNVPASAEGWDLHSLEGAMRSRLGLSTAAFRK
eukprot:COSAG05_NODE_522_length_9020_cov_18.531891_1_plen_102_part_00